MVHLQRRVWIVEGQGWFLPPCIKTPWGWSSYIKESVEFNTTSYALLCIANQQLGHDHDEGQSPVWSSIHHWTRQSTSVPTGLRIGTWVTTDSGAAARYVHKQTWQLYCICQSRHQTWQPPQPLCQHWDLHSPCQPLLKHWGCHCFPWQRHCQDRHAPPLVPCSTEQPSRLLLSVAKESNERSVTLWPTTWNGSACSPISTAGRARAPTPSSAVRSAFKPLSTELSSNFKRMQRKLKKFMWSNLKCNFGFHFHLNL